jgi:hypothetical protein
VRCTAVDGCANTNRCSFTVTITDPADTRTLEIEPQGDEVVISWPVTCETYVLERAGSFGPTSQWEPVTGEISAVNGRYRLIRRNSETVFYRLRKM